MPIQLRFHPLHVPVPNTVQWVHVPHSGYKTPINAMYGRSLPICQNSFFSVNASLGPCFLKIFEKGLIVNFGFGNIPFRSN